MTNIKNKTKEQLYDWLANKLEVDLVNYFFMDLELQENGKKFEDFRVELYPQFVDGQQAVMIISFVNKYSKTKERLYFKLKTRYLEGRNNFYEAEYLDIDPSLIKQLIQLLD